MALPPKFSDRIRTAFLADEGQRFLDAIAHEPAVSIRKHPYRNADMPVLEEVSWANNGYYLSERPEFIFDPAFHAGAYYVQESSSMFLAYVLGKIVLPQKPLVLDLCAAPGGKTTLLLSELPENALLVANEVIRTRVPALKENVQRWGFPNILVTNADPNDFRVLSETFDLVLVDAPCSGEGMFRKDPGAVYHWSEEALQTCELRQKRILSDIAGSVKMGGYLIYSTCTFNPGENEAQVQFLLDKGFEIMPILAENEFPEITRIHINGQSSAYAFYPHRVKGEGLFMCVLKKTKNITTDFSFESRYKKPFFDKNIPNPHWSKEWLSSPEKVVFRERNNIVYAIPTDWEHDIKMIASTVQTVYAGVAVGAFKGKDFFPDHALALSTIVKKEIPNIELEKEDALRFLKKESLRSYDVPKGLYAIRFSGLNIGWGKAVPGRLNNLLPMEFRIRKHLEF